MIVFLFEKPPFRKRSTADELMHHPWLREGNPRHVAELVARGTELISAHGNREAAMHASVDGMGTVF